jgi:transcription initiation factor TFIIIB Brf1 subunit/transcription initiation factor TFIIB
MIVCPNCPDGYLEFFKDKKTQFGAYLKCVKCGHEIDEKIFIDRTFPNFDWDKIITKGEYALKYNITSPSVTYRCTHGRVLLIKAGNSELIYDVGA